MWPWSFRCWLVVLSLAVVAISGWWLLIPDSRVKSTRLRHDRIPLVTSTATDHSEFGPAPIFYTWQTKLESLSANGGKWDSESMQRSSADAKYDGVGAGMTEAEVIALLGSPTHNSVRSEEMDRPGYVMIHGVIPGCTFTAFPPVHVAEWRNDLCRILITFEEHRVISNISVSRFPFDSYG